MAAKRTQRKEEASRNKGAKELERTLGFNRHGGSRKNYQYLVHQYLFIRNCGGAFLVEVHRRCGLC